MLPHPQRAMSTPAVPTWSDIDDDDGWQDMPVVRSDDNPFGLDEEDQKRYHYQPPARLDSTDDPVITGNATGTHLEVEADTLITDSWRDKLKQDESDYTRLRLDEDEESDEVHMRTKYLFDEDKAMTPISQMQATKNLLTEGQRIAYVGLCHLIARRMLRDIGRGWEGGIKSRTTFKGKNKTEVPVIESGKIWMLKIMARLYQHMELEREEQRMIESLAEHGVDPSDLVPALMTTHTVKNPEFDPNAKKEKEAAQHREEEEGPPAYEAGSIDSGLPDEPSTSTAPLKLKTQPINPFGDEEDDPSTAASTSTPTLDHPPSMPTPIVDEGEDGDIGGALSPSAITPTNPVSTVTESDPEKTPQAEHHNLPALPPSPSSVPAPLPALPGVSTTLSTTDEVVTLDIRWTVLCDLFLVLIADSVYDSRSRVFLERVALALGFEWLDVVRFENRVTDALEIQEGIESLQHQEVIEERRKKGMKKRYAMMGLAAVGGGLVIGLSAGLLAPVIGAGLGAAFATVGVTGTTSFLAGTGGAAIITTGGVLTGSSIAGKGMGRRTREVRTFEFRPLHNNKRVNCYITLGGFMASKVDDVRLPFSVLDPIIGDVFSVLWEPEMMSEMGNALKILTTEVITQVGQQVLQATLMTALMSALQWPLILTKLGYLIDNPWSNALDRSRAAGLVLADTLIQRHAGVRPISLIGYSLGARAIYYALVELARVKAYGIVQDVYLFGTTVTAPKATWLDVRSVIAGRFVNGFASSDWMLGYLFRATSGGLNTVAGLRPVEAVPGLENVEVTDIITGHMSYRTLMPQLLARVGFPVTAEYFDEPDDPETDMSVQERTIVNEEEEEAKKNQKKILGLFPRGGKTSRSASGSTTPIPGAGVISRRESSNSAEYTEDEDLPPREASNSLEQPRLPVAGESRESIVSTGTEEDPEVKAIPKTAGFDFGAISRELGKDIDVDHLRQPAPIPAGITPAQPLPLERSESAPPPHFTEPESSTSLRSKSSLSSMYSPEDEIGDITSSAGELSISTPSFGDDTAWSTRPGSAPLASSPYSPVQSPPITSGYDAWSGSISSSANGISSTPFAMPTRSAPPARPHPPEFLANPFASNSIGSSWSKGILGTKSDKDLAEENPW